MADQADVETALAAIVATALYPNGTGAPSVTGDVCRIYRGAPNAPALDKDLAQGVAHVTVMAEGAAKNVTRFPRAWTEIAAVPETLTVMTAGLCVTFAGVGAAGQLAGLRIDGRPYAYAVQANDTAATVASNMAAELRQAGLIVTYAGATLTFPAASTVEARVVYGATALQEIRRQEQAFRVSLWCPSPALRDALAPVLDIALMAQGFIALADGSCARLRFTGGQTGDGAANATLYRRDLVYLAEYPTVLSQMTPAMLFGTTMVTADAVTIDTISI
ncbi:hypothetical protein [Acidocella sp.]|uniref:hypothetical protein n=1 Tax=Acidocella sp. TaxID=50710 RepID=UPI00261888E2|nr:hypothetical protein [Acidocella sp.]